MSEVKPLRQEEYAAMAEELRRTKAEVTRLRDAPRRRAALLATARRVLVVGGLSVAIIGTAIGMFLGGVALLSWKPDNSKGQKYPCYFTRHHETKYEEDHATLPWEQWKIYRNDPDREVSHEEIKSAGTFATQNDAWNFIQKWQLEACR